MRVVLFATLLCLTSSIEAQEMWQQLSPLPSTLPGKDICFINEQNGFIVNSREILSTQDAGNSWDIQMEVLSANKIEFYNSTGFIIGNNGVIYKSDDAGDSWELISTTFTDHLNAITLIDENNILITSPNSLFVSDDGGALWNELPIEGGIVQDSYFTSLLVGHAACKNGTMLKTIDGGLNWYETESSNTIPSNFFRVTFVNDSIGFATQEHNDVYRTIDGGETWTEIVSLDAGYGIFFINDTTGFIAGEHGAIHKTIDGGQTWNWVGFDGRKAGNDLYSIFFIDESIGFATGLRGRIIKTVNGGTTWSNYHIIYDTFSQILFLDNEIGFSRIGNMILKSADGGKVWQEMGPVVEGEKTSQFDFVNETIGYAIAGGSTGTSASSGFAYKTIDGGMTWNKTNDGNILLTEDLYSIDFINENIGFVSGGFNHDATFKTIDGGISWKKVADLSFNKLKFVNQQTGFAMISSARRLYKSDNGGESWVETFVGEKWIKSFYFLDESNGYVIGDDALMYKTTNGGASWNKVDIPYEYYIDVAFYNTKIGFILDEEGNLLKTSNGGITWETAFKSPTTRFVGIELRGEQIFVYGGFGLLYSATVSIDEILNLEPLTFTDITASTATLSTRIESNYDAIQVILEYGTSSGNYANSLGIAAFNGYIDQDIHYYFENLKPSTQYYCRLKINHENNQTIGEEFSFVTKDQNILTDIAEENDFNISIYPNPANKILHINSDNAMNVWTYTIHSISGILCQKGAFSNASTIDISQLNSGVYIILLRSGDKQIVKKIYK